MKREHAYGNIRVPQLRLAGALWPRSKLLAGIAVSAVLLVCANGQGKDTVSAPAGKVLDKSKHVVELPSLTQRLTLLGIGLGILGGFTYLLNEKRKQLDKRILS